MRLSVVLILMLVSTLLFSCGATRFLGYYLSDDDSNNGRLSGEIYTAEDTIYKIGKLPSNWKRLKIDGGDLAFTDQGNDATITVDSTCDERKTRYSLRALSESLLIGIKHKEVLGREEIEVDGNPALESLYTGTLYDVPLTIATVVFIDGVCVYDFTYSSTPSYFKQGFVVFENFVSEFKVIGS